MGNRLKELHEGAGQSVWVDYLGRDLLDSGELERLIEEDGISGVTSNPSIFRKAICGSQLYDELMKEKLDAGIRDERELFQELAFVDVGRAADLLLPVYERWNRLDGYVSIEVSPDLAHDTDATIAEARHIFQTLDRPNILIKVPGTIEGIPAIEQLTSEGVNVNVTLLFSPARYDEIAEAYIRGLIRRLDAGLPLEEVFSVASFFVSRVDTLVDKLLEERIAGGVTHEVREHLERLMGRAAVANAKFAYEKSKAMFASGVFLPLVEEGAHVQKLVWGSTSTKNPAYSDIKYVQELIAPNSINTLPADTIDAYRDHGEPKVTIEDGIDEISTVFGDLSNHGIYMEDVALQLETEGVKAFSDDFFHLLDEIAQKRDSLLAGA